MAGEVPGTFVEPQQETGNGSVVGRAGGLVRCGHKWIVGWWGSTEETPSLSIPFLELAEKVGQKDHWWILGGWGALQGGCGLTHVPGRGGPGLMRVYEGSPAKQNYWCVCACVCGCI